jgi:hypothetical protein
MSCEVQIQEKDFLTEEDKYTVILKTPYLIFFQKTEKFINLTPEEVKNLKIPFVKRIFRNNVPYDVYPKHLEII